MIKSYDELTINKYLELQAMLEEEWNELELQVHLIAILSDMTDDEVLNLSLDDYQEKVRQTSFLLEKPKTKNNIPNHIIINKKKYTICKKINELSVAQYIDYQTWMQANNGDKYIANILSCFVVPDGHKYGDGYDLEGVMRDFGEYLSIQDAINIAFFFFRKYHRLISGTLIYLDWKIKRMARKAKDETTRTKMKELKEQVETLRALVENGVG